MIAKTHEDAIALLDRYVEERNNAVLLPTIRALLDHEMEGVIAIQRGSGNEMSRLVEFLVLTNRAGLLTDQEAMAYIRKSRTNPPNTDN